MRLAASTTAAPITTALSAKATMMVKKITPFAPCGVTATCTVSQRPDGDPLRVHKDPADTVAFCIRRAISFPPVEES